MIKRQPLTLFTCSALVIAVIAATWLILADRASLDQAAQTPPDSTPPIIASNEAPNPPNVVSQAIVIRARDTLSGLLSRHGVASGDALALARGLREAGADLRAIRAGQQLALLRDEQRGLIGLHYVPSPWSRFEASLADGHWEIDRIDVEPELRLELREGQVENSLWNAVDNGAVEPQTIVELARIFESEFDFALDTRPGDRFRVLVEARYADGQHIDDGKVLAAQYEHEGEVITGIGFDVDGRRNFYDLDGRSLNKMFLRSPLQFTRISSGFTYRRPHPVLGGIRPHLAIDYAAPTGTPVWAVADGTVEFAGRKGGNGIQVLLRHRHGYKTYYNHLSRVAAGLKPGMRVTQKQVIGYVGSTGLSTGPHLDYRVSIKGKFINPLDEDFLPGDPIPAEYRLAFAAHAAKLLTLLRQREPLDNEIEEQERTNS